MTTTTGNGFYHKDQDGINVTVNWGEIIVWDEQVSGSGRVVQFREVMEIMDANGDILTPGTAEWFEALWVNVTEYWGDYGLTRTVTAA